MIFIDGIFHADPHAGNLFLLPDGQLGLLDYGQVPTVSWTKTSIYQELF
jgi:predicted unusual protein kinase regulating ubiquinone biosynthesis (AarF/ABC1/UbiB family)